MIKFNTKEQVEAAKRIQDDLDSVWKKTAAKDRKFRVAALTMYLTHVTSGRKGWNTTSEEKELADFLIGTKVSDWVTFRLDEDGNEQLAVILFPPSWSARAKKEAAPAPKPAKEKEVDPEDEILNILDGVRGK